MADEHDKAGELDDGKLAVRDDPDGERVGNLTLDDLDEAPRPAAERDLVAKPVDEETDPLANAPAAPEEAAGHTESQ